MDIPTILCSNARAPVAQLAGAFDWHSEYPYSNSGSIFFFLADNSCAIYTKLCAVLLPSMEQANSQ